MSTNYERGRAAEIRAIKRLKADGWFCMRSAGSLGPADVCAICRQGVRLLQVKLNGWSSAVEAENFAMLEGDLPPGTLLEQWRYDDRKHKPRIRRFVNGEWRECGE